MSCILSHIFLQKNQLIIMLICKGKEFFNADMIKKITFSKIISKLILLKYIVFQLTFQTFDCYVTIELYNIQIYNHHYHKKIQYSMEGKPAIDSNQRSMLQYKELSFQDLGSASKKMSRMNVLVLEKISNIVSAYYDNFDMLNAYYQQIQSLIDYNKKLIQILNQFQLQEEKLIKRLAKMEQINIEYMRQYCQVKGRQFKMPNLPEHKSIFANFNLLDMKINCNLPEPPIIDIRYKQQLISILNEYFLTPQDQLYLKIQKQLAQKHPANKSKELQKIKQMIEQYHEELKDKNQMKTFNLLRRRSQIRKKVEQYYDKSQKNVDIRPDYENQRKLIDKIINLHSKVEELNEETLQLYIKQERGALNSLEKQRYQIQQIIQEKYTTMQSKYTQIQQKYKESELKNKVFQEQQAKLKQAIGNLQSRNVQYEKQIIWYKKAQSQLKQNQQKNIRALNEHIEKCRKQVLAKNEAIAEMQIRIQQKQAMLRQIRIENERKDSEISLKNETIEQLQTLLERNLQNIEQMRDNTKEKQPYMKQNKQKQEQKNIRQQVDAQTDFVAGRVRPRLLVQKIETISIQKQRIEGDDLFRRIRQLQNDVEMLNNQIIQLSSEKELQKQQSSKLIKSFTQKIDSISNEYGKQTEKMQEKLKLTMQENKKMEENKMTVENLAMGVYQALELVSSMSFNEKIKQKLDNIKEKLKQILAEYQKQMEWDIKKQAPGFFKQISLDNNNFINSSIFDKSSLLDASQRKQQQNMGYSFDISNVRLIKQAINKNSQRYQKQPQPQPQTQIHSAIFSRNPIHSNQRLSMPMKQGSLDLSNQHIENQDKNEDYQNLRSLYQQAIQCLQMQQKKSKSMQIEYQRFVSIVLSKQKKDINKFSLQKQVVYLTRLAQQQKQMIEEERIHYNEIFRQNISNFKVKMNEQIGSMRANNANSI